MDITNLLEVKTYVNVYALTTLHTFNMLMLS